MKKIIDHIANWLVALNEKKAKANEDYATFIKRGNNGFIIGMTLFGVFFLYMAHDLYKDYGNFWLASIPILAFVIVVFSILIADAYKAKLRKQYKGTSMRLVGFNMDFNERILLKIYNALIRHEFLNEDLTNFADFYNVLVLDFDEHESELYFICTQPQLKYILEKFKYFKKGLRLKTFERSQKIYHKGNPIFAETLSKKYSERPPGKEFETLVDSFFDFLGG
ncbi:unnamed protein product [Ectocarpus sp. 12 AP-2014]